MRSNVFFIQANLDRQTDKHTDRQTQVPPLSRLIWFVVVFVMCACHTSFFQPCWDNFISYHNTTCLFPVFPHCTCDLWGEQSSMSSKVRFYMLIQFYLLLPPFIFAFYQAEQYGMFPVQMDSCLYCTEQLITTWNQPGLATEICHRTQIYIHLLQLAEWCCCTVEVDNMGLGQAEQHCTLNRHCH